MQDFLTFQTFITPTFILIIYYFGALVIPIASWYIAFWIKKAYLSEVSLDIKFPMTGKQRFKLLIIFLSAFLCMEICWRMIIEFFIAYFDMHDALMKINCIK